MTNCKFYNSERVVKNGVLRGSQLYLCKECRHKFCDNGNLFARMRVPAHIITTALNLYFNGLSVRKVSNEISEIFGETVSQVAVWGWVQKYSKMASEYVETLKPALSGKYHHDETEIKVGGEGRWFRETIDEGTRFLVAHALTQSRTTKDAIAVFRQGLAKQRPKWIFTDGSYAYDDAIRKAFYTRYDDGGRNETHWVRRVGIRARQTNNIVERVHGTLKDRLRPMRGLKHDLTAKTLLDGYVTYYNYCRVHQSIAKTPAQAAGIDIKGWKQLIENAQATKTKEEIHEREEMVVEVRAR